MKKLLVLFALIFLSLASYARVCGYYCDNFPEAGGDHCVYIGGNEVWCELIKIGPTEICLGGDPCTDI